MKLLQAGSAALAGMALCSVVYAYQRTADFGFSDDEIGRASCRERVCQYV